MKYTITGQTALDPNKSTLVEFELPESNYRKYTLNTDDCYVELELEMPTCRLCRTKISGGAVRYNGVTEYLCKCSFWRGHYGTPLIFSGHRVRELTPEERERRRICEIDAAVAKLDLTVDEAIMARERLQNFIEKLS